MQYYHASRAALAPGTILENRFIQGPMRFEAVKVALQSIEGVADLQRAIIGNRLQNGPPSKYYFLIREAIFERIRSEEYAELPSRLNSIFVGASIDELRLFRAGIKATNDRPYLYSCEIADQVQLFVADMHFATDGNPELPLLQQINHFEQYARSYWKGEKCESAIREVLAPPGTVKIVAATIW